MKFCSEETIPWQQLAFQTVTRCLRAYFADRKTGRFVFHEDEIRPPIG